MEAKPEEAGHGIQLHFSHRFHYFLFDLPPEYWPMTLAQVLTVIGIFAGMFLCLALLGAALVKLRLYNAAGLVVSSVGTALIFSAGSFALIGMDKKFENWGMQAKLGYVAQIFLLVFVFVLILISTIFAYKRRS